jgi:succinate dehydrogenase / fumarate reductase cytochrome b subunit
MKFALFTGCVARGATRELMLATIKSAEALGIDFVEMKSAACCGAGVVSEKNPVLTDAINARTFALAEEQNLDIITICSTCQGNLKKSECHLDEDVEYKGKINYVLKEGGHQYHGGKIKIKHFSNILATPEGMYYVLQNCLSTKTRTTRKNWKSCSKFSAPRRFIIPAGSSAAGFPSL